MFDRHNFRGKTILPVAVALLALAATSASAQDYRFEVKGPSTRVDGGWATTVALIDTMSGLPVTNAEVYRRGMLVQTKIPPGTYEKKTALTPDGQGNYQLITPTPPASGKTLSFGARVPGKSSSPRGFAEVPAPAAAGVR